MAYGARKRPDDGVHRVREGDTISSIGVRYGFTDWQAKIWDAPENAELKTQRVNPNTLMPDDEVFIPELTTKDENRPTDDWHDFHVIRNKRFLRLKLQDENSKPLANKPYQIRPVSSFRGTFVQQGVTTDDEGRIEEAIPHTMAEAELVLPDDGLTVKLNIGHLHPLPASDPVKSPIDAMGDALGDLAGAAKGSLSGAGGALGGLAAGVAGVAAGSVSGSFSTSGGSGGGGASASGAADLAGAAESAFSGFGQLAMSSASALAGPITNAVSGVLGALSFGDKTDPNIFPSSQRLESMGFDPGRPTDNKQTPQFTAAVMAFQTWCKERGELSEGAGGLLGDLTSPGGAFGGGGGMLGDMATAVAGPLLASVGLTGQLDEETIEAVKTIHGC